MKIQQKLLKRKIKKKNNFLLVNKKIGETPKEVLDLLRFQNKKFKNLKMTYAGRLDPMAEGLLLMLLGEECKNKEKYLSLDKEYVFEILFGFSTDTYDILGKVVNSKNINLSKKEIKKEMKFKIKDFIGKTKQKYPIYSSKTVKGRPLFSYARAGEEVEIPRKEIEIKSLEFLKLRKIKNKKLLLIIEKRIKKVKGFARPDNSGYLVGDFRQGEILEIWQKELKKKNSFYIAKFKVTGTSGMYVRSLANNLGNNLKIPSLAFSIKRTKIGNYAII